MNTFIINECQLGYSHDFYQLVTDAKSSDINKHNILPHRATWVKFSEIVDKLEKGGFSITFSKIEPSKSYQEYLKSDNFIQLKYGNY